MHSKEEVLSGFVEPSSGEKAYDATHIKAYYPDIEWKAKNSRILRNMPQISGTSAMVVDMNTNDVLFEKNAYERRCIASLTKIMTAIVAMEHAELKENIRVSAQAASIGENIMGVSEGEVYTLEELLYGLLLPSGNDAAYAIADGIAGDTETFVEWMNIKAKELVLKDTYFADPSGLDNGTYSTAFDMIKLTRYALKDAAFRKIVATEQIIFPADTHKYHHLYNQTNLLGVYPGVVGVKTGYTGKAGLCLVTYAKNSGADVLGVVLGSDDRRGDMILMLDYSYSLLGVSIIHNLLW